MSVTEPIFIAQAGTDAAIRAAALAANNAGGGRVKIPSGRITLSSSLPCYNGVVYEGTPVQQDMRGGLTTGTGGTILVGDGTFTGLAYNDSDLSVAPTVFNTFIGGMVVGAGCLDITFENFLYGIKIGGKYNPGVMAGRFERNNFLHCAQFGAWFENYWDCDFVRNQATNCTVGEIARVASGATAMNCGNSRWYGTSINVAASLTCRGLVTWARFSSRFNQETTIGEGIQRTTSGLSQIVQAATMSNGSANITITDGTKFAVDMPVQVSTTTNGFTAKAIYFVASVASNVITLRSTQGYGTAINATAGNAVNIISNGFALVEVCGLDASSAITGCCMTALDIEGFASALMIIQNSSYHNFQCSYADPYIGGNHLRTFVLRASPNGKISNGNTTSFHGDLTSQTTQFEGNRAEIQAPTFNNSDKYYGQGFSSMVLASQRQAQVTLGIALRGVNIPEVIINSDTQGIDIESAFTIGQGPMASGHTVSFSADWSSAVFSTAAGGTMTLPAITANNVGTFWFFSNPQANACVVSGTGNNFDGLGTNASTSSVAAHTSAIFQACDTGSTKYWARYT